MAFFPGMAEIGIVVLMLGSSLSGGGLMGLPPAERDAAFLKTAPADSLLYAEWAERSTGKSGAPGIDGLMADPEIRAFYQAVDKAILTMIERETAEGSPEEQILGKAVPPLVKSLLMRPGCVYVRFDQQAAVKAIEDLQPVIGAAAGLLGLQGALIINGGDDADAIAKHIIELQQLLPPQMRSKDLKNQVFPLPLPGAKLTLHRHENYFVLAFGEGVVEKAVAGLSGKSTGGLASNPRFAAATKLVAMERTGEVSWLDVKGIVKTATEALGGPNGQMVSGIAKMIGADAIDSIVSATGIVDGQIRSKSFMTTSGKTEGILALVAGRAIKPSDLALVPADSDLVVAFSLNTEKVYDTIRTIVQRSDPSGEAAKLFDGTVLQLEKELELNLKDDVFASFGDVWTLHDSPSAGGLFVTSLVASLEVKDAEKANATFTQLMKILKQAVPGDYGNANRRRGVYLEEAKFMGKTIYYVNTVGDDVPFAPAFCVTDKQLLAAPHPQALKAHLRFLQAKQPGFDTRIAKVIPKPDGDLLSVSFIESKTAVRYLYALVPYLGQLAMSELQRENIEIDIFSVPSARAILPYTDNAFSMTVRTKDGIYSESQSILPIPGASTMLMQLPSVLPFLILGRVQRFGDLEFGESPAARTVAVPVKRVRDVVKKPAPMRKPASRPMPNTSS
jgi:hypothetical protein